MMAGIDSELPDGACVVSVMHMVNPATFWVSEPPGQDMTTERSELQALEETLQAHCRHVSFYQQGCYLPEQGEMVAVEHPETHRWHRGIVEGVLNTVSGFLYNVFLVDHGVPLKIRSSSIQELPASCKLLGYQAVQVVLHGVVPVARQLEYEHSTTKTMILDHWTAAAVRFVRKLLDHCVKAYVVCHKNTKEVIFGDLYLEQVNGIISLKKELCDNEYAIINEEIFERGYEEAGTNGKRFVTTSSTDGCSSHDRSPCRSPRPETVKPMRRNIREYLSEYNEAKRMKPKDIQVRIEQWRQDSVTGNDDEDIPLGRGTSIRRRPEVSPGRMMEKQQSSSSADKSLLDLLDMMSGIGKDFTQKQEVSEPPGNKSQHITSSKSVKVEKKQEASKCISYMPAGSALPSNPKNKVHSKHLSHPLVDHNKKVSNSTSSAKKSKSAADGNTHRLNGISSQDRSHAVCKNTIKVTNNLTDNEKVPDLSVLDKNKMAENLTDSKKLADLPLQDDRIAENSTVAKKVTSVPVVESRLNENSKEHPSNGVSVVSSRPVSLLERLQEKAKQNKQDNIMQKIMDGVIKSSQSKSQVQLNNFKSSAQRNDPSRADKHHLKNALGLPMDCKLMDRSNAMRLLVHGDMRSHPIKSIADANFPPEIHQALGIMDFNSPMRMQMHAWPAIMRGQYAILVGPPHSGKTLSYVVPVVSFMLTPDMYSELPPGNGPLVLVLCSGSRSAEFVYEKCCSILHLARQTDVRVQLALGGSCEIDLRDQLANGCDILVSTPRCFLRLLKCSHLITNLDRLAHLVVDEIDILANKFLPEVKKILNECKHVLMRRSKVAVPIQLIATSEKWCPAVEQFSQHVSQDFVICISGHLEAAIYAKLQPTLHYLSSKNKVQALLDILDGHRDLYKTLVVCKDAAEVDMLEPFFVSQCFNFLTAHEDKTNYHNKETYLRWKTSVAILVCSDDVLPELDAHDASWLIHYSLPPTKTKFGFRFSSLMNNYTSVFHKPSANDGSTDCKVDIFMDKDSENKELPEVVQFMRRLSVPVHPELEARAAELIKQQEAQKSSAPLCYYIKAFGECLEKKSCPNRHIVLKSLDEPVNFPRHGNVKLKILHVLDASRFAARLLHYTEENGSIVQASDDYFVINTAVLKHYSNERNRGLHGIPKLGDICGLENKINTFQRVQVVEIAKHDEKNVPELVRVFFLDEGIYKEVKVYQLLNLPAHLQQLPPQTVEVFLCSVVPCDFDTSWSLGATNRMSSWIRTITAGETDGKFVTGRIVLSLGNTLWLDPLKCCSHLESLDTLVTEVSLRTELLKSKLAVENSGHLNTLLTLCRQAQIQVPSYCQVDKDVVQCKEALPAPQWAHLPCGDYQAVIFVYANDPYEFFVRRDDFDKCFQELVADIQDSVKTKPKDFQVEVGSLCLGKFPADGVWYRARVSEMLEDQLVSLFFVDHGDFASVTNNDIAPITPKLITKLPFQAIECSLVGVRPVQGDIWCEDATDVLYDFANNCDILHVKVCEVLEEAHCTGGKKYQVLCVDTSTRYDIVLNDVLLKRNLAISDNPQQFKEEHLVKADDSSDDDIEIDNCVMKLSDVCKEVKPSDLKPNIAAEEEEADGSENSYDIQVGDLVEPFVRRMLGLDKLVENMKPSSVGNTRLPALPAPNNTIHRTSSLHSLSSDEECIPPLASHMKTPEVLWYQDYYTIGVKIKLTGVKQYYLSWDINQFLFRTQLNDDVYEVGDVLFGPMIPSELSHSAKGLYVHIKTRKAVHGFTWPRLFNSKKRKLWLKYDLDMYKEDSGISLQHRNNGTSSGLDPREWEEAVIIPELADTDEEDDDVDDGSDMLEPMDAPYDPLDPFS